jgi:hypothetical protein
MKSLKAGGTDEQEMPNHEVGSFILGHSSVPCSSVHLVSISPDKLANFRYEVLIKSLASSSLTLPLRFPYASLSTRM